MMATTYPSSPPARIIIGYSAPTTGVQQQQSQQQQQPPPQQINITSTVAASAGVATPRKSSLQQIYRSDGTYIYDNSGYGTPLSSAVNNNDTLLKNQIFVHNSLKSDTVVPNIGGGGSGRSASCYENGLLSGSEQQQQPTGKNEVRIFMYPPSSNMEAPIIATTLSSAVNDLKLLVNGSVPSSTVISSIGAGGDGAGMPVGSTATSSSAVIAAEMSNIVNGGGRVKLPGLVNATSSLSAGSIAYDGMTHILVQNRPNDGIQLQQQSQISTYSIQQQQAILQDRRTSLPYVLGEAGGDSDGIDGNSNHHQQQMERQRRESSFAGHSTVDAGSEDSSEMDVLRRSRNSDVKRRARLDNESEDERARRRARDAETKRARRQRETSEQRARRLMRDSQRMRRTRRIKRLLGPNATLSDLKKTGLSLEDLDTYNGGRRRGVRNTQESVYLEQQGSSQMQPNLQQHHQQQSQPQNLDQQQSVQIVAAAPPQSSNSTVPASILYDLRQQQHQKAQLLSQQPQQQQPMVVPLVAAAASTPSVSIVQQPQPQPQLIQTQNGGYVTVHWTLPPGTDPNNPPQILHLPAGTATAALPQHIIVQRSPPPPTVTLSALQEDGKPHIIHVAPPPSQHHVQDAGHSTIISSSPQILGQRQILTASTNRQALPLSQQQQQKLNQITILSSYRTPTQSHPQQQQQNLAQQHILNGINLSHQQAQQQQQSTSSHQQQQHHIQQYHQQIEPSYQQHDQQQVLQNVEPSYHQTIVYRTAAPSLQRQQQQQQQIQVDDYEMDEYKEFIVQQPTISHQQQRQQQHAQHQQSTVAYQPAQQKHQHQRHAQSPQQQQFLQNSIPSTSSYQVQQNPSKGRRRTTGGTRRQVCATPSVYTAVPPPPRSGAVIQMPPPMTVNTVVNQNATIVANARHLPPKPQRRSKITGNKQRKPASITTPLSERFRGLSEEQIRRRRRANAERSRRRRQLETPDQRRERNRRTAERMRARRARMAVGRFSNGGEEGDASVSTANGGVSGEQNAATGPYIRTRQVVPLSSERFEEIFQRVLERCRNPSANDTLLSVIAMPHPTQELKEELHTDNYGNDEDIYHQNATIMAAVDAVAAGTVASSSSQIDHVDSVESILHAQMCATPSYIVNDEDAKKDVQHNAQAVHNATLDTATDSLSAEAHDLSNSQDANVNGDGATPAYFDYDEPNTINEEVAASSYQTNQPAYTEKINESESTDIMEADDSNSRVSGLDSSYRVSSEMMDVFSNSNDNEQNAMLLHRDEMEKERINYESNEPLDENFFNEVIDTKACNEEKSNNASTTELQQHGESEQQINFLLDDAAYDNNKSYSDIFLSENNDAGFSDAMDTNNANIHSDENPQTSSFKADNENTKIFVDDNDNKAHSEKFDVEDANTKDYRSEGITELDNDKAADVSKFSIVDAEFSKIPEEKEQIQEIVDENVDDQQSVEQHENGYDDETNENQQTIASPAINA